MYQFQKHASVKVGNICNNRCLGCDISAGEKGFVIPSNRIKKELLKIKKAGFESIELIGGEITIQKNFLELFEITCSMFPKITLATNGRIFVYEEFVKEIIKIITTYSSKLNLEIAVYGPNAIIHDSFTQTSGSFKEMMEGMKNIFKYRRYFNSLGINTLVVKSNYKYLDKILDLILKFGLINTWYLISFAPVEGRALNNIKNLMPRYKDLLILNEVLSKAYNNLENIDLNDFPYCLFKASIINDKNDRIHIINSNILEVEENKKIIRNLNATFSFNKIDYLSNVSAYQKRKALKALHDSFRIKLPICQTCLYFSKCDGIWDKYVNLFGLKEVNSEIQYLNKINNFL